MKMLFLVDGDNNIGTGLRGVDLLSEKDVVLIFYKKGLALTKIKALCAGSRADIQYIESIRGGKNSIDFQIITELGVLIGRGEADYAYIISQDKGYEASLSALRARYADTFHEAELKPSIEDCLKLNFLLRARTRRELCSALTQEFGSAHGGLLYGHLKQVFQTPDEEAEKTASVPAARAASAAVPVKAVPAAPAAIPAKPVPAPAVSVPAAVPGKPASALPVTAVPSKPAVPSAAAAPAATAAPAARSRRGSRGGRRRKPLPAAEKIEAEK